ncbi:MAG: cysteine--tRNA ligase, partial [Clostridiales bacterium]|nr:cysteine--tRNA ligase [Clostridiales bacterium]
MKIYNTLTRKKEEFVPLEAGKVKMYACGITVSGEAHIGHGFQALIYDIFRKFLQKQGFAVTYARNYTDVDDKIIAKSKETGIPADKYAQMMIEKIDEVMARAEVDEPTLWLKATENIGNIISFIQELISKGHAYPADNGDVYFDVDSFPSYGKLSGRDKEDALDGVRVENDESKKNAYDFALWKAAKAGEIFWESPWGKGRPGWHIECSAMSRAAFGEQLDIHGGGRDLIFPHHENEIAQSEALSGKTFAKYWVHNGLIKVNGQKMSKSLGNSLLMEDLLAKYSPEAIKFALLSSSYRGDVNITDSLFPQAEAHLVQFYSVIEKAEAAFPNETKGAAEIDEAFDRAMSDDFNTALALADLFGYFKEAAKLLAENDSRARKITNQIRRTYALLGLFKKDTKEY